jgi:hypothetical protein
MNWMKLVAALMQAIPVAVYGVEAIAKSAPGSTKKEMAMNALGVSSYVASLVDPQHKAIIEAATQLASNTIEDVVKVANATGDFDTLGVKAPQLYGNADVTALKAPAPNVTSLDVLQEARGGDTPATFRATETPDTGSNGGNAGNADTAHDTTAAVKEEKPRMFGGPHSGQRR